MAKAQKKAVRKKKKERKNVEKGQAHIQATFNNTLVTITDMAGNAISWSSAGSLGFRGSRKSTPFGGFSRRKSTVENSLKKPKKVRKVIIQKGFDDKSINSLLEKLKINVEIKDKTYFSQFDKFSHQVIILDIEYFVYNDYSEFMTV